MTQKVKVFFPDGTTKTLNVPYDESIIDCVEMIARIRGHELETLKFKILNW